MAGGAEQGVEGRSRRRPVDSAVTGPEMLVFLALVVMRMDLDDAVRKTWR